MTGLRLSRVFWIGAAAILIVAALIAVTAILRGDFGDTEAKILGTLLALLVAGATAISGLGLIERRTAAWLGGVAIAGAAVGFGVITAAIWDEFTNDTLGELAASAIPVLLALLLLTHATAAPSRRAPGVALLRHGRRGCRRHGAHVRGHLGRREQWHRPGDRGLLDRHGARLPPPPGTPALHRDRGRPGCRRARSRASSTA